MFTVSMELYPLFVSLSHKVPVTCCSDCHTFLTDFLNGILLLCRVWMSQKLQVNVFPLPLTEPSVETIPLSFVWLSHQVPVTFLNCFQMDTSLHCFFLSHCWTILIINCVDCHKLFPFNFLSLFFSGTVPFSLCNRYTWSL